MGPTAVLINTEKRGKSKPKSVPVKTSVELTKQITAKTKERKQLNKEISALQDTLNKTETEPKMRKMIGKCFKYRNNFGSGCKGWWMYSKILDVWEGSYIVCTCQRDANGVITIETRRFVLGSSDYLFQYKITKAQFNAAINRGLKILEKMKG